MINLFLTLLNTIDTQKQESHFGLLMNLIYSLNHNIMDF